MPTVRVNLFGQLGVECDGRVWHGPEGCKARELFCYLLVHHAAQHNRELLASLLWEESSAAQSKKYLRQALWQFQAAWDEHMVTVNDRFLVVSQEWVQVNPEIDLWVDAIVFDQTFSRLRSAHDLDEGSAQAAADAVRLYKDDLLVGWYQEWCLYERERLQNMYLVTLDKLMAYCEINQDYAAGLDYGARILRYDPAREITHQRMMLMYYLSGDRTAALRQFDRCAEALKKELDVSPTLGTRRLREQICADSLAQPSAAQTSYPPAAEPSALLPAVLMSLKQLQNKLIELQGKLQQDIQTVEQALPDLKTSAKRRRG